MTVTYKKPKILKIFLAWVVFLAFLVPIFAIVHTVYGVYRIVEVLCEAFLGFFEALSDFFAKNHCLNLKFWS